MLIYIYKFILKTRNTQGNYLKPITKWIKKRRSIKKDRKNQSTNKQNDWNEKYLLRNIRKSSYYKTFVKLAFAVYLHYLTVSLNWCNIVVTGFFLTQCIHIDVVRTISGNVREVYGLNVRGGQNLWAHHTSRGISSSPIDKGMKNWVFNKIFLAF